MSPAHTEDGALRAGRALPPRRAFPAEAPWAVQGHGPPQVTARGALRPRHGPGRRQWVSTARHPLLVVWGACGPAVLGAPPSCQAGPSLHHCLLLVVTTTPQSGPWEPCTWCFQEVRSAVWLPGVTRGLQHREVSRVCRWATPEGAVVTTGVSWPLLPGGRLGRFGFLLRRAAEYLTVSNLPLAGRNHVKSVEPRRSSHSYPLDSPGRTARRPPRCC